MRFWGKQSHITTSPTASLHKSLPLILFLIYFYIFPCFSFFSFIYLLIYPFLLSIDLFVYFFRPRVKKTNIFRIKGGKNLKWIEEREGKIWIEGKEGKRKKSEKKWIEYKKSIPVLKKVNVPHLETH